MLCLGRLCLGAAEVMYRYIETKKNLAYIYIYKLSLWFVFKFPHNYNCRAIAKQTKWGMPIFKSHSFLRFSVENRGLDKTKIKKVFGNVFLYVYTTSTIRCTILLKKK